MFRLVLIVSIFLCFALGIHTRLTLQIDENEDYPLFKFDCDTTPCNDTVAGTIFNGLFTTDAYCQYIENTPETILMNGEIQSFSCAIVDEDLATSALTNFSEIRIVTRDINSVSMTPILESGSDRWLKSYHMTLNISKVYLNPNAWEVSYAQVTTQYFGRAWRKGDIITRQYTIHNASDNLKVSLIMLLTISLLLILY